MTTHRSAGGGTGLTTRSDRSRRGDVDALTGPTGPASSSPAAGGTTNKTTAAPDATGRRS